MLWCGSRTYKRPRRWLALNNCRLHPWQFWNLRLAWKKRDGYWCRRPWWFRNAHDGNGECCGCGCPCTFSVDRRKLGGDTSILAFFGMVRVLSGNGVQVSHTYRQTSNTNCTLVGNEMFDHSDVVGASPVGAAPTTSSFSTYHLVSMDWTKTTTRRDEKHFDGFGIWRV